MLRVSLQRSLLPRWSRNCRLFSVSESSKIQLNEVIQLPTNKNSPELLATRHSTAHILAMAVQRLFPDTKIATGPWTDNGFFYDFFSSGKQMSEHDLILIKKEMVSIVKSNLPITREVVSKEEAKKRIIAQNEKFKLDILDSVASGEEISLYHIGSEWWDLCKGPHLASTGKIDHKAFELNSISGAYWKGDEKNGSLQRIYGTSFLTAAQLKEYKFRLEEAKLRDHRTIGAQMDLFSIQEGAGGGLVFWHPKGALVRRLIEDYWKQQHFLNGYELLNTPHLANLDLWKTSGHTDFYKEDMFRPILVENDKNNASSVVPENGTKVEDDYYQLKPMNCPLHCLVYKNSLKSYREFPLRWAELGTVYRYEKSGSLHGLFRVRGFTQDDAHVFCLPSQLQTEIVNVLNLIEKILSKFGFKDLEIMLSTRPPQSVGSDNIWEKSTEALVSALKEKNLKYEVDEGGGAFYGPKIDIKIRDAIGRSWQCSTIQCDFNLPERFDMEFVSDAGTRERPIMIHRAIFGSLERFFGILIENTKGDFPLWLNPTHLRLLPVVDEVLDYCQEIKLLGMTKYGLRIEIDKSGGRVPKMIRNSEIDKIPVTAIIGKNEKSSNNIAFRVRKIGEMNALSLDTFLASLKNAVDKNLELHEIKEFEKKPSLQQVGN